MVNGVYKESLAIHTILKSPVQIQKHEQGFTKVFATVFSKIYNLEDECLTVIKPEKII